MSVPRRIAIIGAGFSGTATAWQLLRRARAALEIVLVEREPRHFARGVAYSTFDPGHVLNVPAGRMSGDPEAPDDFVAWLEAHGLVSGAASRETYAARQSYGHYLEQRLREAEEQAAPGVILRRIVADAVDAVPAESGWRAALADGRTLDADALVLALGNFPPSNPDVADASGYDSPRYYHRAWQPGAIDGLAPDDTVLLIGTGLTSVDMLVSLTRSGHRGQIHAVSRHGLWPLPHAAVAEWPDFLPEALPRRTAELMSIVRKEMATAAAQGVAWPAVVNALRRRTAAAWQALPAAEQRRFLRHVRPWWEVARHRMPSTASALVGELGEAGRLTTHRGRLHAIVDAGTALVVEIGVHAAPPVTVRAARVVNCAAAESNHRRLTDPLVRSLLARGLVHPDPLHLGLATDEQGRLEGVHGPSPHALYTLGPCRKGTLWETTAVPEIREQAAALAAVLLE